MAPADLAASAAPMALTDLTDLTDPMAPAGPIAPTIPMAPTAPGGVRDSGRERPSRLTLDRLHGPGFGPITLQVAEGERVGLFGLIGSGRTSLLETVFGRRRASGGTVRVGERTVSPARPADALAAGIALVPADRRGQGVFASLSARENVLLPSIRPLARYGVRDLATERKVFDSLAAAVGLRPARPGLPAGAFSGGNQQKLVLGRWINEARSVDVLLLDEPTQGVDVGGRHEIYRVVSSLAEDRGMAVLFASSDPEEVVALADRCLIVAGGRIVGELSGPDLTEQTLLSVVHGAVPVAHGGLAVVDGVVPAGDGASPFAQGGLPAADGDLPVAHGGLPAAHGALPSAHGASPAADGAPPATHGGDATDTATATGTCAHIDSPTPPVT
ncbi:ATP-binding cassette domain-containing protein, partial [Streptomyces diastatochromogenes]|uniref:ATP-binding cassette domain-containing protein n=1 Tax=Streptomyces diastatochromogenes TaxID=42236 RepID=UPI001ABF6C56